LRSVVTGIPGRKEVIKIGTKMLFPFVALGLLSLVHAGPFLIPSYTTTTNTVTWYTYTSTSTIYNSCYQVEVADINATPFANVQSCSAYIAAGNFYGKKRRKRSELMNEDRHEAQEEISPTKAAESPEEEHDLTPFRNDPRLLFAGYTKEVASTMRTDTTITEDMRSLSTTITHILHACNPGIAASLFCQNSEVISQTPAGK